MIIGQVGCHRCSGSVDRYHAPRLPMSAGLKPAPASITMCAFTHGEHRRRNVMTGLKLSASAFIAMLSVSLTLVSGQPALAQGPAAQAPMAPAIAYAAP